MQLPCNTCRTRAGVKGQESEQAAERLRRLMHKYVLQELQQTCWIWKRACVGEVYYQQLRLRSVEGQDLKTWVTPQMSKLDFMQSAPSPRDVSAKLGGFLELIVQALHVSSLCVTSTDHSSVNPLLIALQNPPYYPDSDATSMCPALCLEVDRTKQFKGLCFRKKTDCITVSLGKGQQGGKQTVLSEKAHRVVMLAFHGPPLGGWASGNTICMHLCHNIDCLNPNHLKWGSKKENHSNHQGNTRGNTSEASIASNLGLYWASVERRG